MRVKIAGVEEIASFAFVMIVWNLILRMKLKLEQWILMVTEEVVAIKRKRISCNYIVDICVCVNNF